MNKTSKKQKGHKKRPDKIKNKNSGKIEKPEHPPPDTALVKFDPLQRYLAEISKYKLLTREQEIELGKRVREEGDTEAAYVLLTANLRLVVKIALEFQRVWMQNLLDLIQEGNIGLMQAVKKFDPYKNVKFSYYASFWIKAYILKFIMDNWRLVKIGTTQGQRKLFFKLKKEKQKLIDQGFDPKPKLLSERLGVSEREIVDMDQRLDGWDVSLDAPLKDDSDAGRIEFLSSEVDSTEDQMAKKEIETLLHKKIDDAKNIDVVGKQDAAPSETALVKFDPLQRYLAEISKYNLITREQEQELGRKIQEEGDTEAAYVLVTANLRLVVKIALEFQRLWMQNLLDLIQEGNIGLIQAVRKFDPYKNVKFSYYASFWIKAYILKFIMDNWRLVKIGTTQGQRKLFFKLKKEKQKLVDQGFDPKPKLLSEKLGVSEREIVDMDQRLNGWDVSLDAPLKDDSDTERIELLDTDVESTEDRVARKEIENLLHNKIDEFKKTMSPRELEIFEKRIFSDTPATLQKIGDRYGISRERVRQVENNIIKKLREYFKREIPDFESYNVVDVSD